jgi:AraC-like DNA-binding protein
MVRSAALSRYPELALSLGLDPARLLARVGLSLRVLEDPDCLIAASAVCRLLEDSAAAAGVEDFGLRLSENRGVWVLGPLGMVIREEATVRDALSSLERYIALHSEAMQMQVDEDDGLALVRCTLVVESAGRTRQADEMSVGTTHRIMRELIGAHWRPRWVCFAHDAPGHTARHAAHFGAPVEFGAGFTGIVCTAKDLEAVPPTANARTARYARDYVEQLQARADPAVAAQVKRLVHSLLSTGRCSIDCLATQLGVDRRTIHRRLAREGATYTGLVDEVRAELAAQHLSNGSSRAVADIAGLLGFSLQSSFAHWFSRRFGCSPSAWRAAHGAAADRAQADLAPSL